MLAPLDNGESMMMRAFEHAGPRDAESVRLGNLVGDGMIPRPQLARCDAFMRTLAQHICIE